MSTANPPNPPPPAPLPTSQFSTDDELSLLQFAIGRYDHYFDSVNNKANFWLAFNTFLLGGVIAVYKDLVMPLGDCPAAIWLDTIMISFIMVNVGSTGFILWASLPFLTAPSPEPNRSALYYADVSAWTNAKWHLYLNSLDKTKHRDDHRNQVHALAGGLHSKYKRLWIAGCLMILELVVLLALILIFIGKSCPPALAAPDLPKHIILDTPVEATVRTVQPLSVLVEKLTVPLAPSAKTANKKNPPSGR